MNNEIRIHKRVKDKIRSLPKSHKNRYEEIKTELYTTPKGGFFYNKYHGERLNQEEKKLKVNYEIHSIELNDQFRLVYQLIKLNDQLKLIYKTEKNTNNLIIITNADDHMIGKSKYRKFSEIKLKDIEIANNILAKAFRSEWITIEEIKIFGKVRNEMLKENEKEGQVKKPFVECTITRGSIGQDSKLIKNLII